MNPAQKTPEIDRLVGIMDQAEESIAQIAVAVGLLESTYGAGCTNLPHFSADQVNDAARLLTMHLSWLKARAAALAMLPGASEEMKKRAGMIR